MDAENFVESAKQVLPNTGSKLGRSVSVVKQQRPLWQEDCPATEGAGQFIEITYF